MLIEVDNICQEFPSQEEKDGVVRVLDGISFTAERTETVCILGPSGCGKSTVLRMISGMHDRFIPMPTSGEVRIDGNKVTSPHDKVLTVFQRPVLKAWLNVEQNIRLPFKAGIWAEGLDSEEIDERVATIVEAVGLTDATKRYPSQLSGGMQQRVSLAARLVLRPEILCLDEPFSALDPQTRLEMQELALKLWKLYPCVAFFVTHDVAEALRIADRIIVLSTRPARVVADMIIMPPKPRPERWDKTAEYMKIEQEIISHIRDAATQEQPSVGVTV